MINDAEGNGFFSSSGLVNIELPVVVTRTVLTICYNQVKLIRVGFYNAINGLNCTHKKVNV